MNLTTVRVTTFGCFVAYALTAWIATTGAARSEGAYVLNTAGGGSVLPADCSGFTTIVSDSKPISTRLRDGTLTWTSSYLVEPSPGKNCRMGLPLCVMTEGRGSRIGSGYVIITAAGRAQMICQGAPVFD